MQVKEEVTYFPLWKFKDHANNTLLFISVNSYKILRIYNKESGTIDSIKSIKIDWTHCLMTMTYSSAGPYFVQKSAQEQAYHANKEIQSSLTT